MLYLDCFALKIFLWYLFVFLTNKIFFFFLQCVFSEHGLLTTVAYKLGRDKPVYYALEVSTFQLV